MSFMQFIRATLVLSLLALDHAWAESSTSTFTVIIEGIPAIEGRIKIKLLKEGEDAPFRKETAPVDRNPWTWVQKDIPYGRYSIKVFHDRNGNGELDTGMWGIPTEAYGFSNNARSITGPPDIEDTLFEVSEPETTVKISIQ
jgi:uncharacterized protein (DUF2141 family)